MKIIFWRMESEIYIYFYMYILSWKIVVRELLKSRRIKPDMSFYFYKNIFLLGGYYSQVFLT